jgi:hypothetical protein
MKRRKFGRKRRSIYVKYRVSNKNEAVITNDDNEHSQEYIARRQPSNLDESTKEEEEEEMVPAPSPPKPTSKQPTFKQLTIDHFMKKIPSDSPIVEKSKPETVFEISPVNNNNEETVSEVKNDNTEEFHLPRRTKRLSNTSHISKSEADLVKMANGTSSESLRKPYRKYIFRKS